MKKRVYISSIIAAIGLSSSIAMAEVNTFSFKKGEMMCLVSSIEYPNSSSDKQLFFSSLFPIYQSENVKVIGALKVEKVLAGEHDIPNISLVRMPNREAKSRLDSRAAEWKDAREKTADIWKEKRQIEFELSEGKSFVFDSKKYYQLEAFWVKAEKLDDFQDYLDDSLVRVAKQGGKRIHQFGSPYGYSTLGMERAPDFYLISEWKSMKEFNQFWTNAERFKYLSGYNSWLTSIPEGI